MADDRWNEDQEQVPDDSVMGKAADEEEEFEDEDDIDELDDDDSEETDDVDAV